MGEKRRPLTKVEVLDCILFNMDEIKLFKELINDEVGINRKVNFYNRMIKKIEEANKYLCKLYRICV